MDEQQVAVLLPNYCGLRSDGTRYVDVTQKDTKGEVVGMSGSMAVVVIKTSKPLKKATLELLGPSQPGAPEQVLSVRDMEVDESGKTAIGQFDLEAEQTAYRIVVWDTFGFASHVIPRRGITLLPDEPPLVTLLPERFGGSSDDNEVEGIPIPIGAGGRPDRFRVAYQAHSPAGLYAARFRYRLNDAKDFAILPLTEYKSSPEVGPFDLNRGVFKNILDEDDRTQVDFHAMDVTEAEMDKVPPRLHGGGRFDFETAKIPGIKVGDKIEFYVEVLDTRSGHLIGRSESRLKDIVTFDQFQAWRIQREREKEKLEELAKRDREAFDKPAPGAPQD